MPELSQYKDNREPTQFHVCPVCGYNKNISPNYCGKCKSNLSELSMKQETKNDTKSNKTDDNDEVRCPSCQSNQFTVSKKGFSAGKAVAGAVLLGPLGIAGGLIGSDDIVITCLKCGQKWSPKH